MQRDCPRCWKPLEPASEKRGVRRVEIDRCDACDGFYLDSGELKRLTGSRKLHKLTTSHLGADADSQLVCPGCGGIMDAEHAGEVEFEVCLTCHGVWLDAGELEKLRALDSGAIDLESDEKLAEFYDAGGTGGLLRGLFGRRR